MPGEPTFTVEVLELTDVQLTLSLHGPDTGPCELPIFLADYPELLSKDPGAVRFVQRPQRNHLYWPLLDLDLSIDGIQNPDRYPLVFRPS